MWEKIKPKALDTLATFLGSFIGLYMFNKFSPLTSSLFVYLNWEEELVEQAQSFVWALFIAVGFIIVLISFGVVKALYSQLSAPSIIVTFLNQRNKFIQELDFSDDYEEPHYLKISFKTRFSKIQLWFIKSVLKAKIKVSFNPKMCSIDLAEGFIANNKDFYLEDHSIYFDFFSKYSPSKEISSIYMELNLLLIHSAEGRINIELDLSKTSKIHKCLFMNYCKFDVADFIIEG